jgi:hypothetical protein
MSTRTRRPRCVVCRTPLPDQTTRDKCSTACRAQTVLFPKRLALRLSRPRGGGR